MYKLFVALLSITVALYGCAGATPAPVPQYQPGDTNLRCDQIAQEMADNNTHIMHLVPKQDKTGKNVILGVAGAFLLVPWFFMDFSDAERIEIQAYQLRNNWLRNLAYQKHCGPVPGQIKFCGR